MRPPASPEGAPPPAQLTSFIGRERETAAVQELLAGTRLLTLTGAGGSGKTRLALEVASRVGARYPDGVAWVELAPLSNPELVPHHVADALGVRRDGIRSAGEALLEALRNWEALLVLDNCEHLVDACARLAEALLRGCPRLRIMTTSREALGIGGERAWLVPALTLPESGKPVTRAVAADSEAIRLFVERTQAVRPSVELIDANGAAMVQVCRRLDGLPLAIELAAARARVLDPQQIAARLDDVFGLLTSGSRTALPHHRTLRSTIEWSHALLTEQEQILFRRLAVFAGGFTIDAVEVVAQGGAISARDVLDLLSGLVDKSLVLLETEALEARYRMLETIRQFARERLEQTGEAADLGRRHAPFFLARAQAADPFLPVPAGGWQGGLPAGGDRSGGRGERGDPARNGRHLGGPRVRARGARAVASARRRPGRRRPRAGGGPGRGAGLATALLDHLRAVLAGLRGASQRRPRGRARGVRRGRRPRARGWLQRAHRAPRHHARPARPRRSRQRGRVEFLRHRTGVAQADEEPLVHDHPGGRPGTDRGRSGRRRAGDPLARRGGQPARGSRGRPTAARARDPRPSRRNGSCQPRRSGVRSGVPGGAH